MARALGAALVLLAACYSVRTHRGSVRLTLGTSRAEVERRLGRAPYEQPDKELGAERLVYVFGDRVYIARFVHERWVTERSRTSDWPTEGMHRSAER
jgi:hypothetical protein